MGNTGFALSQKKAIQVAKNGVGVPSQNLFITFLRKLSYLRDPNNFYNVTISLTV